jgi:hypothetical protein
MKIFDALKARPELNDQILVDLLHALGLDDKCDAETKSYSDCMYRNYRQQGLSFCFDLDNGVHRLAAVHVYGDGNGSKFDAIQSGKCTALPFGLTPDTSIKDLIVKFAPREPEKGGGGRTQMNIWIKYPEHGVMIEFPTKSWDVPPGKLTTCAILFITAR